MFFACPEVIVDALSHKILPQFWSETLFEYHFSMTERHEIDFFSRIDISRNDGNQRHVQ